MNEKIIAGDIKIIKKHFSLGITAAQKELFTKNKGEDWFSLFDAASL